MSRRLLGPSRSTGAFVVTPPKGSSKEDDSMFDFVIAIVALSCASIFFAHAVEVFLTQ